jgi:hypothetical protein
VCSGDGRLTAAHVRAAALPGWIIVGRVLQWPKFARESYRTNQPKGRFLTLSYRPTQPQVAARSQRWVNPPDISIAPKQAKPIKSKIRATLALVVPVSRDITPPPQPCRA